MIFCFTFCDPERTEANVSGRFCDFSRKKLLRGSSTLFTQRVCGLFQEMPGQLGDPAEISGAKGTADVTVSGPKALLPPSLHLLGSDRKMPSEESGSKTR